MSIFGTILSLDDDDHEPGVCAVYKQVAKSDRWDAATFDGRYWQRTGAACTCGNQPPLIYRGSHVNPSAADPRGGVLLVCGIPDHCHPDARFNEDDDHGAPVGFLRLFAYEDETTYQGSEPGQATLVLTVDHVRQLRDTLTEWLDTRAKPAGRREDGGHAQH